MPVPEVMRGIPRMPRALAPAIREQQRVIHSEIHITPLSDAICNVTRIQTGRHDRYLGRTIREGGRSQTPHGIDFSDLWVIDRAGHSAPHMFALPQVAGVVNWEDPRSWVDGEKVYVGLTAVSDPRSDGSIPYAPAVVEASFSDTGQLEVLPESLHIFSEHAGAALIGRNVTPYGVRDGRLYFFMRVDDGEHNHVFSFFRTEGETLTHLTDLPIPKVWWNSRKAGTAGAPIQLNNGNYLFLIHGQAEEGEVVRYRMGFLEVNPQTGESRISREPVLVRSMFPFGKELRPWEKEVVYGTDTIRLVTLSDGTQGVESAVSVGDDAAAEVFIPLSIIHASFEEGTMQAA